MLVRYKTLPNGKHQKQALIYTVAEHAIRKADIDRDAIRIVERLQDAGHAAYVVGGAVRDLMTGNKPKDFDIVTDAEPGRIRRLFRNSRVIGKRFRLVHVFFADGKIIEVSTFRSIEAGGFKNIYGAIEEDALRRDFTMNALFYNPVDETVLDYSGGVRDIRRKRICPVIPLDRIFAEDPFRIIRAVKYAVSTEFAMTFGLQRRLRASVGLLAGCSPSRLTEELFKILMSGRSESVFAAMLDAAVIPVILPNLAAFLSPPGFSRRDTKARRGLFFAMVRELDIQVRAADEHRRSRVLAYFLAPFLYHGSVCGVADRIAFTDAVLELKEFLKPVVAANRDVEIALVFLVRRRKNYRKFGCLERPDGDVGDEVDDEVGDDSDDQRRPSAADDGFTQPEIATEPTAGGSRRRRRPRRRRTAGPPTQP